jgi:hypothetical protein
MPEHDLVDIGGGNPGIGERLLGNAHNQALDRLALEPAEGCVSPTHDASGHGALLSSRPILRFLLVPMVEQQHLGGTGANLPNFGRFLRP